MRKSARVFIPSTALKYTLPPFPPSPPSGPPNGTNFSRRKLTEPRPPLPACTLRVASSTNFMASSPNKNPGCGPGFLSNRSGAGLFGDDVHEGIARFAAHFERHASVSLREQRVVGADTDVHTRMPLRAALADENIACEHLLTAELLHAEALAL